ncbi:MAG: hypothetical protein QM658_02460 [Gordonia sp. (in: high G+C Gram-positive bacteria)]
MTTAAFEQAYAAPGALTLRRFEVEPDLGDMVTCRALLSSHHDDREIDRAATAYGPIGAMSEILYGLNAGVEIVSFYTQPDGDQVAAYLQCTRDSARCWAFGRGRTSAEAAARALISASNQLAGPATLR